MKNYKSLLLLFLFVITISTAAHAQQVFVANLSGAQEVPAVTSPGRGVCRVILNPAQTQISVNCNYSGLSSAANAAHIHGNAPVGANAPVLFNFGAISGTSGTITNQTFTLTPQQVADLRQNRMYVNVHTANNPGGEIRGQLHVANAIFDDYDGDGRTDVTVFRPSNGTWYSLLSLNNAPKAQQWGLSTDITPLNSDFDGDGISDYAMIRPNATDGNLTTFFLYSATNTFQAVPFGNAALGDTVAAGDYDGDGKYDIAVFRRGLWVYIESTTGAVRYFNFGQQGDSPVRGSDFDRDGKADFNVVRNVGGQLVWYILQSSNNQLRTVPFGLFGDTIVSRNDFDGDGASDITVTRSNGGNRDFYTLQSSDGQVKYFRWGFTSDALGIGDFDGDGKSDYTVYRNQNNSLFWYIFQSTNNQLRAFPWGAGGDL
jgi:hypothetical protein